MHGQSRLTDDEWALVEHLNTEFGFWRRTAPAEQVVAGYLVRERDMQGVLGIINRLSKSLPKEEEK